MMRPWSPRRASLAGLLMSTAVLSAMSVASIRSAPAWTAIPLERPLVVRAYRSLNGMVDYPKEGFQPAMAGFVEYIDPASGQPAWWLDSGPGGSLPDFDDDTAFTGRDAMVFEKKAVLGIWFQSVRIRSWDVTVFDAQTGHAATSVRHEPALASALRAAPPQELPPPSWSASPWSILDLLGIVCAGVCCWSMAGAARRRARRSPASAACESCGYDLAGLLKPVCPECGNGVIPDA